MNLPAAGPITRQQARTAITEMALTIRQGPARNTLTFPTLS